MSSALVTKADIKGFIKYCVVYIDEQFRTQILCVGCRNKNSIGRLFIDLNEYWVHVESEHWHKKSGLKICHHDFLSIQNETFVDLTESGDEDEESNCPTEISNDNIEKVKVEKTKKPPSTASEQDEVETELSRMFGDHLEVNAETINTKIMNTQDLLFELNSAEALNSTAYTLIPTPEASPVENRIPDFSRPSSCSTPQFVDNTAHQNSMSVGLTSPVTNRTPQADPDQYSVLETSQEKSQDRNTSSSTPTVERNVSDSVQDAQTSTSKSRQESPLVHNVVSEASENQRTRPNGTPLKRKASQDYQSSESTIMQNDLQSNSNRNKLNKTSPSLQPISYNTSFRDLLEAPYQLQESRLSAITTIANNNNNVRNELLQNLGLNMEVDTQLETNTLTSNMEVDRQSETNTLISYMDIDRQSETNTLPSYVDIDRQSKANTLPSYVDSDRQSETNSSTSRANISPQAWRKNSIYNRIGSYDATNVQVSTIMPDNREQNLFSINTCQNQRQSSTTAPYMANNTNNTLKTTTTNNLLNNNSSQGVYQKKTFSFQDYMKSKETIRNRNEPQNVQSSNMGLSNIHSSSTNINSRNIHAISNNINSHNIHASSSNMHASSNNINSRNIHASSSNMHASSTNINSRNIHASSNNINSRNIHASSSNMHASSNNINSRNIHASSSNMHASSTNINSGNIHANSSNMHASSNNINSRNIHTISSNMHTISSNIPSYRRPSINVQRPYDENSINQFNYQQNQSTSNSKQQTSSQSALNTQINYSMAPVTNGYQHLQTVPKQPNNFSFNFRNIHNGQPQMPIVNQQLIQIRRNSCQTQELKCKECRNGRKFKTEDNLKKHFEKYHGNGKGTFYCEPCERRISNKAIKKHYDTQTHKDNLRAKQIAGQIIKRRKTIVF